MRLTVTKGNMYPFVDYTTNPLAGKCPHDCVYCYMKDLKMYPRVRKKYSGRLRVSRSDLEKPTGKHKVRRRRDVPFVPSDVSIIFVCSENDLGVASTATKIEILRNCCDYPSYGYLLQSKNPAGLMEVEDYFPLHTILGTTVETDRTDSCEMVSNAPPPVNRIDALNKFDGGYRRMISVEPKLECNPFVFSRLVKRANPDFVSLGADRGGRHNLPEPNWESVLDLIDGLEDFTVVFRKENLWRLGEEGGAIISGRASAGLEDPTLLKPPSTTTRLTEGR